jgi:hypothetical protein
MAAITANLVTATQLNNWAAQHLKGRVTCTADEWCYIMNNSFPNAAGSCKSLDTATLKCCGFTGSNRTSLPQITAESFLSCLLNTQQAANTNTQGPGGTTGNTTPAPVAGGTGAGSTVTGGGTVVVQTPAPTGQGVLGLTNCSICQQLASNPLLLILVGVGIWYFFFDKSGKL